MFAVHGWHHDHDTVDCTLAPVGDLASRMPDILLTASLSLATLAFGVFAIIREFPLNGAVALAGIVSSLAIQLARMWFDSRLREARDSAETFKQIIIERDKAQAQLVSDRDKAQAFSMERIKALASQVDAANARILAMFEAISTERHNLSEETARKLTEAAQGIAKPTTIAG